MPKLFSWLETYEDACGGKLELQASTYLIPLLLVSGFHVRAATLLQPASVVVACVGTVGILRELYHGACAWWLSILAIALHLAPVAVLTRRAQNWRTRQSALVSTAVLYVVLATYIVFDTWPYSISPFSFVVLGSGALALDMIPTE